MSGATTTGRPTGGAPFRVRRAGIADFAVAGVVVAMLVAVPRFLDSPHLVDRLAVENPTGYDISIEVTDQRRRGWVAVGTAQRATTSAFEEIVDQGDVWIFRFSTQGEDGGELQVSRQQLERDGWRMRVPAAVGEQLEVERIPLPQ